MLEEVLFVNQSTAEQTLGKADWIVISVTQPSEPDASLKPGWRAVLRLRFHDTDEEDSVLTVFSVEQAREVVAFVAGNVHQVKGVLVHCHAGVSRSAAIAKFIGDFYDIAEFVKKHAGYVRHNKLVYRRLVDVTQARR